MKNKNESTFNASIEDGKKALSNNIPIQYFTFLGTMYAGNWETAFIAYQNSRLYNTFSDWLKDNLEAINSHKLHLEQTEREFLTTRLTENKYNITKTAEKIGITRIALYNKIINLKIEIPNRKLNYIQYKKVKS